MTPTREGPRRRASSLAGRAWRAPARAGAPLGRRGRSRTAAFTLIEMIAVGLLMALVAAVVLPNMGFRSAQNTLEAAESVAALLEFGRARAVMTGLPHRVVVDFEQQRYWLEAKRLDAPDPLFEDAAGTEPVRWSEQETLPLVAPKRVDDGFVRATGPSGRGYTPPTGVWFRTLETAEGPIDRGQVFLPFAWDGSTEGISIWLEGDGGHQVLLEVAPLADQIRIERVDP